MHYCIKSFAVVHIYANYQSFVQANYQGFAYANYESFAHANYESFATYQILAVMQPPPCPLSIDFLLQSFNNFYRSEKMVISQNLPRL